MKKVIKHLSILSLLVLFFSAAPLLSFAEDVKDGQLLYDLNYDKDKSVLTGKTKPNANVFINEQAGSIVADDDGNFEIPITKGLKESTVLMLDALGETSTDLKFNFEKNTVETEETTTSTTSSSSSSTSSASNDSKTAESEEKTSESKDESSESDSSTKESSTKSSKESNASISSESYSSDTEEEKRSLIWLWTLLIVLGVVGLAVAAYFWYKKKVEEEEKQRRSDRRKRSARKKASRSLEDDFEDDLYESLKISTEGEKQTRKSRHSRKKETDVDEMNLDDLINSELEKATDTKRRKSSSSGVKKRKKKSKR